MPAGLLSPQMLLVAVAGRLRDGPPLAVWARELSDSHAALLAHRLAPERGPVGVDHARVCARVRDMIRAVDEYAAARLVRRVRGAAVHAFAGGGDQLRRAHLCRGVVGGAAPDRS
ncbi:hypothetical protein ACTD5D_21880 [Nocardia takedensis]|uniref:hypothetical protein n=1 Tax=Nocardia takedensis TaxID=259390 RepID=UPI003F75E16F